MRGAVFITTQMLDAGYLMLDIQECSNSEIQKYQVSSDQDPGSANADHDFRRNNSD